MDKSADAINHGRTHAHAHSPWRQCCVAVLSLSVRQTRGDERRGAHVRYLEILARGVRGTAVKHTQNMHSNSFLCVLCWLFHVPGVICTTTFQLFGVCANLDEMHFIKPQSVCVCKIIPMANKLVDIKQTNKNQPPAHYCLSGPPSLRTQFIN